MAANITMLKKIPKIHFITASVDFYFPRWLMCALVDAHHYQRRSTFAGNQPARANERIRTTVRDLRNRRSATELHRHKFSKTKNPTNQNIGSTMDKSNGRPIRALANLSATPVPLRSFYFLRNIKKPSSPKICGSNARSESAAKALRQS